MHEARPCGTLIQNRYRLLRILGQGGSGLTYEAEDLHSGQRVALKELSLRGLRDWKKLELFEREAQVLQGLSHPAIPDYIDYFQVDTPDNRFFYLVQELAPGRSLADRVAAGERFDEATVRSIALAVLQILQYLHGLNPPVIHRDIKPQNIILTAQEQVFLVDFGAVQTIYRDALTFGSTVVGTYGYMAPEQFQGQAQPATDLYGLGATLLYLLTHQNPSDLPQKRLKITFRPYVTISDAFADWLEGLIEPVVEDRYPAAQAAVAALTHPSPLRSTGQQAAHPLKRQPAGSRIQLVYRPSRLVLDIPPSGIHAESAGIALFALFWNGFILFWTSMSLSAGAPIIFPLFSIPFWAVGLSLLGRVITALVGRVHLDIQNDTFTLIRQLPGWRQVARGRTSDLIGVALKTAYSYNHTPVKTLVLQEGVRQHAFGTLLTSAEKAWLQAELDAFLRQQRGSVTQEPDA